MLPSVLAMPGLRYSKRVWISEACYEDLHALKLNLDRAEPHVTHSLGGTVEELVGRMKELLAEQAMASSDMRKRVRLAHPTGSDVLPGECGWGPDGS